jgi:hypothetical protein
VGGRRGRQRRPDRYTRLGREGRLDR